MLHNISMAYGLINKST